MNSGKVDFIEKIFRVTMHNLFNTIEPNRVINEECSFVRDPEKDIIKFNMRLGNQTIKAYVACHMVVESYTRDLKNIKHGERNYIKLDVEREDGKRIDLFKTEKTTVDIKYYPLFGNALGFILSNRLQDEELEREYTIEMFNKLKITDKNRYKYNSTQSKPENVGLIYDEVFIEELERRYEEIRPLYEVKSLSKKRDKKRNV